MAELYSRVADSPTTREAERIFAEHGPPLSREAAAAKLAERGIHPPGSDAPIYSPPAHSPAAYNIETRGLALPQGFDAPAWAASIGADSTLAKVLLEDAFTPDRTAPDPVAVRSRLEAMGRDPKQVYAQAEHVLARAPGAPLKATDLSLNSLVALAAHGTWLRANGGRRHG